MMTPNMRSPKKKCIPTDPPRRVRRSRYTNQCMHPVNIRNKFRAILTSWFQFTEMQNIWKQKKSGSIFVNRLRSQKHMYTLCAERCSAITEFRTYWRTSVTNSIEHQHHWVFCYFKAFPFSIVSNRFRPCSPAVWSVLHNLSVHKLW